MTDTFYTTLPVLEHFHDVLDAHHYTAVPATWLVVLTDIQNSTQAIESGHYKAVNMIGASSIMALLNVDRDFDLPFVFGGDGATILIPPTMREGATRALQGLQTIARQEFALHLRVGIVPMADVLAAGQRILVARYRVSPNYIQAVFMGSGLGYGERLIKNPLSAPRYAIPAALVEDTDLTGLECRWQDIPSPRGETISLLIVATGADQQENAQIYQSVLAQIEAIYGPDPERNPVRLMNLKPTFSPEALNYEARLQKPSKWWQRRWYLVKIWWQNLLLTFFVRHDLTTGDTHWRSYLTMLRATSDFQKYDGMLRMIIAGDTAQRTELVAYLDQAHQRGELCYGVHVADRALLTCIVFDRMGKQVHFVDGADGGYALAAQALKQQQAHSPQINAEAATHGAGSAEIG